MSRPLAIAHRAGNSLAGLQAANELGVDVIECDVHDYRGRLEVRHLKTAGPLPFLWDRWELASATAPRLGLRELLTADRLGATYMLDLKGRHTRAGVAVAKLLHDLDHHSTVIACGRHWPSVEAMAKLPFVRQVLSARTRPELARLRSRVTTAPRLYGVSVHVSLLDAGLVAELKESVDVVMSWPINDPRALDAALDIGINGIISDQLSVLAQLLGRRDREA